MNIKEFNATPALQNEKHADQQSFHIPIQSPQMMKLFETELNNICRAEKSLAKAIPKMISHATSQELIDELTNHLVETENQIFKAEQVFKSLCKQIIAEKCGGWDGLSNESGKIIKSSDASVISTGWNATHYEIASFGTLRQLAKTLGLAEVVTLLEATLNEEKVEEFNNIDYKTVFVCPGQGGN